MASRVSPLSIVLVLALVLVACKSELGEGVNDNAADSGGEGDTDSLCTGVDCSGAGTCVDDSSSAACECDAGYMAEGTSCVPFAARAFLRLNIGGSEHAGTHIWVADASGSRVGFTTSNFTYPPGPFLSNTSDEQALLGSARWWNVGAGQTAGATVSGLTNGTYAVRFLVAEGFWTDAGQRIFGFAAESVTLDPSIDPYALAAGQQDVGVWLDYNDITVDDGELNIAWPAVVDNPEVRALELAGPGFAAPAPIVALSAAPSPIVAGRSAMLTWSSTHATSCSATGDWSGAKALSGSESVSPAATATYALTCTGAGGSTSESATVTVTAPSGANLLFASGFEGATALRAPSLYGNGAWQDIVGADSTTGFTWPGDIWGGGIRSQMIVGAPVNATTLSDYMFNRIETVTGHDGNPTQAMYSEIKKEPAGSTQEDWMLQPASEQGDMYVSFWLKFQPDLLAKMTPQNWRALFSWKTSGDYRVGVHTPSWDDGCGGVKPNGPLFWRIFGDNNANGGLPLQEFWRIDNCSHTVPVGEWFKFEIFWHRSSGTDGRVWMAVNGQVIADRYGHNKGVNDASIDRIALPTLYSDTPSPIYQWVDDLEVWDGFPPAGGNPPYAPH